MKPIIANRSCRYSYIYRIIYTLRAVANSEDCGSHGNLLREVAQGIGTIFYASTRPIYIYIEGRDQRHPSPRKLNVKLYISEALRPVRYGQNGLPFLAGLT